MSNLLYNFNYTTVTLLSLALILAAGFFLTRITKIAKLPNVTGYIIAGILIGPYVLNFIPHEMVENMSFISDIALAFIAFGIGQFFTKEAFKETGFGVFVITITESLVPGIMVTLFTHFVFCLNWSFCMILGAIATATAPASTMVTIRQYHARGNFVNTLLQVVAFDDAVCLISFSLASAFVSSSIGENVSVSQIIIPVVYNIGALAMGFIGGIILSKLITPNRSQDNRLILTISLLLGIAGLCAAADISPLLSCMVLGTTYINITKDRELFKQVENFTPPVLSVFFVVSGMRLDISSFRSLGIIGVFYFVTRIVGKYIGAYIGCLIAKSTKEVRDYLGLALIPQAGVAIGLAFLGERILPGGMGNMLLTIILSSSVLYELIGPACAKIALIRSGSIKNQNEKTELTSGEIKTEHKNLYCNGKV
ncbi:cation:proton antiporter [Thermoclostridium stercorarium]|uniref:cation:proton antiporter n=1 Tax=Thermoclostridium stercorarium TaxID=1510 RepID=UPI002248792A|nr:cation:proton antiporter [Thermoclostridium stercorarium]UZQ84797.1 cation:proton antiporter [Thermoclostridium stercorarium]